ncbi:hypothetical protein [Agromyces tropicus]|uniref:hypothetical protein n=1 Tax=Agromyces tropicus TaxID=555371 RepID=UPI0031DE54A4
MTDPAREPAEPDDRDRRDEPDDRDERVPQPWFGDQYDVGGLGMGRLFAWGAVVLGAGALAIGLFAPLAGQALRTVWIAGFGAAAMWVAWMAPSRYRRAGVRVTPAVPIAMVLGGLAIGVAIYAFVVIAAASGGVELPAPDYWFAPSATVTPGVPT